MSDKFRFNGTGLEIGIPLSDADSFAISQWAENAADLARKHEQERIIKLLEEQKKTYSSPKYSTTGGFLENFALDQAIELIKGEQ